MAQITVLKTSERGAKLVTDGQKVAWLQGRWVREDNTLTRMGQEQFDASTKTLEEFTYEQEHREEARAAAREAARARANEHIEVSLNLDRLVGETEKAWKFWTGGYQRLYGKLVKDYAYLAKSQVNLQKINDTIKLSLPRWILGQTWWLPKEQA